jgi:protein tyrosine phosphatase
VSDFPIDDHNVPTMPMISQFCEDVVSSHCLLCAAGQCCLKAHRLTLCTKYFVRTAVQEQWLQQEDNVIAVHCKAGKGRTGMMICCWLIHSQACSTSREAIELFGKERTKDRKV